MSLVNLNSLQNNAQLKQPNV